MPVETAVETKKRPRPGTKTEIVYQYLVDKKIRPSSAQISRQTGLSLKEVRQARARVHRHKWIPTPTNKEWRQGLSATRGSIWPRIERYAFLGMTPREILLAKSLNNESDFPYVKVENALNKAWKKGLLTRRYPEETTQNRLDAVHLSRRDFIERTFLWAKAEQLVRQHDPRIKPRTRSSWLEFVEVHRDFLKTHALIPILGETNPTLHQDFDKCYLFDTYLARLTVATTSDRALYDNFPAIYTDIDPQIHARLSNQIKVIIKEIPLKT